MAQFNIPENTNTVNPIAKEQAVRLLDIGLFGPLMVLSALNKKPPEFMRLALIGIGLGSIAYNLYHYLEQDKMK
ncbi:MAG: hypothetical protein ABW166_04670 [Sedimenticola sp.]